MTDNIRFAAVDAHPLFRQGLVQCLERDRSLRCAAEGETAGDALHIASVHKPDVLLLEAAIQGDGIEAAKTILSGRSRTKIMILTALDDDAPVSRALRAGVHGYILKGITGNELIRAVKDVHSGEPYVTPQLAARLLMLSKSDALATKKKIADLSHREQQVLDCLCQGLTDKEIATRLNISRSTIRYYLALVFKKLNVRNRVEALQATDWLKTTSSSSL